MFRCIDTDAQFAEKPRKCKHIKTNLETDNYPNAKHRQNDKFQGMHCNSANGNLIGSSAVRNTPKSQPTSRKSYDFEKPHKCVSCSHSFHMLENLTLHMATHQPKPFRCPPPCGKIFNRLASLDGHIRIHFKSEHFQCIHCTKWFHYEMQLRHHIQLRHPNQRYRAHAEGSAAGQTAANRSAKAMQRQHRCQYCGKNFTKNSLLERHERIHRQERPFSCDKCGKAFTQKYSLVVHQLKHTGERPHVCPKCPQRFSQKTNLLIHMNRCHSAADIGDGNKFACTECSCLFGKLASLNAHVNRCHARTVPTTIEPDFDLNVDDVMGQLCEIAQPSVAILENEAKQQTVETSQLMSASTDIQLADQQPDGSVVYYDVKQAIIHGVRTLICNFCQKVIIRRPADMVRHIRTHTNVKPYECDVCGRRFTVKITLKVHMRVHDKARNKSKIRNSIENKCELDLARHTLRALDVDQSELKIIVQTPNPILLERDADGQVLAKLTNVPTNGKRKFECYICHELFTLKFSLKQHIESHLGIKRYKCNICSK